MSFEGIAIASAGLVLASGGTAGVVLSQGVVVPTGPAPASVAAAGEATPLPEPASPARALPSAAAARASGSRASVTVSGTGPGRGGDIPSRALQAYQVTATVMNAADAACRLDWQLLAAVGLVESDHARTGGSRLTAAGTVTPEILGPVLDGRGAFSRVADTDDGGLDDDSRFDRAVGPMQFLPATWWAVAVDGDDDGIRNPQDIDDAALGAAVYLCFGDDDLGTASGRRAALYRYNHSDSYVERVLAVRQTYLSEAVSAAVAASAQTGTVALSLGQGSEEAEGGSGSGARPSGDSGGSRPVPASGSPEGSGDDDRDDSGTRPGGDEPQPDPDDGDDLQRTIDEVEKEAGHQVGLPQTEEPGATSPTTSTTGSTP